MPFPANPEGAQVQFRFATFNIFNHTQFDDIGTTFGASNFGQVGDTYDPRVIELALKFMF